MTNIIVAFSKSENGKNTKSMLVRNGFRMIAVYTSGGQVLPVADCLNGGIAVSGYRFEGMMYDELHQCLPGEFNMFLISPPVRWSGQSPDRAICLPMPLKVHDLLSALEMMVQAQKRIRRRKRNRPGERNKEKQDIIVEAETLLIERNNMTESEAHRYIQKCSMDSDTNLVETIQMVISLIHV